MIENTEALVIREGPQGTQEQESCLAYESPGFSLQHWQKEKGDEFEDDVTSGGGTSKEELKC